MAHGQCKEKRVKTHELMRLAEGVSWTAQINTLSAAVVHMYVSHVIKYMHCVASCLSEAAVQPCCQLRVPSFAQH